MVVTRAGRYALWTYASHIALEAADGMGMNGYCEACGQKMIAQAKEKLDRLIPLKTS